MSCVNGQCCAEETVMTDGSGRTTSHSEREREWKGGIGEQCEMTEMERAGGESKKEIKRRRKGWIVEQNETSVRERRKDRVHALVDPLYHGICSRFPGLTLTRNSN